MKVAIDTGPLESGHKVRGIGVHTRELVRELKRIKNNKFKFDFVDFEKANLSAYDLIHYQYFSPFNLSLPETKLARKVVVTIHDLIPLIYPKYYKPGIKGMLNFREQTRRLKNVDAIITISETSKKDICRFLKVDPVKVYVVHLAPRKIFKKSKDVEKIDKVRKSYSLPSDFVLYLGDVNYNKNIPNLVKACKIAKKRLVIVGKQAKEITNNQSSYVGLSGPQDYMRYILGKPHPELAHFKKLSEDFRKENIICLGFVPDDDLVSLFSLTSIYCQPSLYEGFGLGILEALACDVPVAASKIQAHSEIAERACLFFNPNDPDDMAQKIKELDSDTNLQKTLRLNALKVLKKYSWSKTAKETLAVYNQV